MDEVDYIFDLKKKMHEDSEIESEIYEIKEIIEDLKRKAEKFKGSFRQLIEGGTIEQILPDYPDPRDMDEIDLADLRYYFQLISPNENFDKFHLEVVRNYEIWYTQAYFIVKSYSSDRSEEFKSLKDGGKALTDYGIINILNFEFEFPKEPTKRELLKYLSLKLDKQLSILIGISQTLHLMPKPEKEGNPDERRLFGHSINVTGDYSKVNVNSNDNSVSFDNTSNFKELRYTIQNEIVDEMKKEELLKYIETMEKNNSPGNYTAAYKNFIQSAADHMTLITPFIPFLTTLLPK